MKRAVFGKGGDGEFGGNPSCACRQSSCRICSPEPCTELDLKSVSVDKRGGGFLDTDSAELSKSSATSPRSPVTSPRSPVTSPRSPATSPRSPATSPRSPATSPRSPVTLPRTSLAKSAASRHTSGLHTAVELTGITTAAPNLSDDEEGSPLLMRKNSGGVGASGKTSPSGSHVSAVPRRRNSSFLKSPSSPPGNPDLLLPNAPGGLSPRNNDQSPQHALTQLAFERQRDSLDSSDEQPLARSRYGDYAKKFIFASIEVLISLFRAGITGYAVAHISLFGLTLGFWPGIIFMAIAFYCLLPVYWGDIGKSLQTFKHIFNDPWLFLGFVCCTATGVSLGFKMWFSFLAMLTFTPAVGWLLVLGILLGIACIGFIANSMQTWEQFYAHLCDPVKRQLFKDNLNFRRHPIRAAFVVLGLAASIIATLATVGAWMTGLEKAGILEHIVSIGFYIAITCATLLTRFVYTIHQALSHFGVMYETAADACARAWQNPRSILDFVTYPVRHPWNALCWLANQAMLLLNALGNMFIAAEGVTNPVFGFNCFLYAASPHAAGINSYSTCAYFQSRKPQHPLVTLAKMVVAGCAPWVSKCFTALKTAWQSWRDARDPNAYKRQDDEGPQVVRGLQPPSPPSSSAELRFASNPSLLFAYRSPVLLAPTTTITPVTPPPSPTQEKNAFSQTPLSLLQALKSMPDPFPTRALPEQTAAPSASSRIVNKAAIPAAKWLTFFSATAVSPMQRQTAAAPSSFAAEYRSAVTSSTVEASVPILVYVPGM